MKPNTLFKCFLLFFLSLGIGKHAWGLTSPFPPDKVQEKMDSLVAAAHIPGINFSIIFNNGSQRDYSAGYGHWAKESALDTRDKFLSGSIGKTYAAALLFHLVDQGKLKLEDRFISFFPDTKWLSRLPNIEEITVEQLLQHRSGLPRWVLKAAVWERLHAQPDKIWTYEDRLSYVFDDPPVHKAGAGWAYSDTNYLLIGMLIEHLMGKAYYQAVDSLILHPLELAETTPSNTRAIPGLVMGYSRMPAQFHIPDTVLVGKQYVFNPQMEWTGGGMASTTSDLARWAQAYYGGRIFSSTLLDKVVRINPNGKEVMGSASYGMASFIYSTQLGKAYGHSGFMPGYNSIFAYYPDLKIAVAIQTNCDYIGSVLALTQCLDLLVPMALAEKE